MEALESSGFRAESQRPRDITEEYDEFSGSPTLALSLIATESDEPDAVNVGPDEVAMVASALFARMSDSPVTTLDLGSVSGFVNSSVAKSTDTVGDGCSDDMKMPSPATKLGTTNTISKIMIQRSEELTTCWPAAGLGTANTIPNTTILSMRMDRPPSSIVRDPWAAGRRARPGR
ncbi:hypothetical protein N7449_006412 [Penicillium cf. viridicatum]|uniref:Uncharacterized protein n=1 Tax=Penicillium cf. viridicatum TaxID=2972119 RepID=A0A9W9JFH2_9EURO|nr:hypothetical protein N7449_006412 [Penicillium cf. viridicatum]